jgi:hypothetical protein
MLKAKTEADSVERAIDLAIAEQGHNQIAPKQRFFLRAALRLLAFGRLRQRRDAAVGRLDVYIQRLSVVFSLPLCIGSLEIFDAVVFEIP